MSKKLIIILLNFFVILMVSLIMIGQINQYKGLKDVCVAKTMIKQGVKITDSMIEIKKVTLNKEGKGKDRVTYYDDVILKTKDVVGQYAAYDMIPGEIIVKDKISQKSVGSEQYLYSMPKGYFAYPVDLGKTATLVRVNDYIDIYMFVKDANIVEEPALRHLRVYDLKTEAGISVDGTTKSEKGEIMVPKYAIVGLNNYQLGKLLYYENQKATVNIALRKRASVSYEVYDYPDISYPLFAISEFELIDEVKEQQLIDANRIKLDNALLDSQNLPLTGTGTTTTQTTQPATTPNTATPSGTATGVTNPAVGQVPVNGQGQVINPGGVPNSGNDQAATTAGNSSTATTPAAGSSTTKGQTNATGKQTR